MHAHKILRSKIFVVRIPHKSKFNSKSRIISFYPAVKNLFWTNSTNFDFQPWWKRTIKQDPDE
ncbi:unnamed protein product [Amoebophrya sp. A120]|nr:unnamed protein product [Amoebophrya sp. A120]|eukprot:GSA120T00024279001.1